MTTALTYKPGLGIYTEEEIVNARAVAAYWQGTPWRNRMEKVGAGIDCLHFMKVLIVGLQAVPYYRLPYYHYAMGLRCQRNIMEDVFRRCCDCEIVDAGDACTDGDVVIFACGDVSNHVGVVLDSRLYEARAGHMATSAAVEAFETRRVQSFLRLRSRGFTVRPETLNIKALAAELKAI